MELDASGRKPGDRAGNGSEETDRRPERINWQGRKVTLVFDSDEAEAGRSNGRDGISRKCSQHGAEVRVVDLPPVQMTRSAVSTISCSSTGPPRSDCFSTRPDHRSRPAASIQDGRLTVQLGADEHRVNDQVAGQLAGDRHGLPAAGTLFASRSKHHLRRTVDLDNSAYRVDPDPRAP